MWSPCYDISRHRSLLRNDHRGASGPLILPPLLCWWRFPPTMARRVESLYQLKINHPPRAFIPHTNMCISIGLPLTVVTPWLHTSGRGGWRRHAKKSVKVVNFIPKRHSAVHALKLGEGTLFASWVDGGGLRASSSSLPPTTRQQ